MDELIANGDVSFTVSTSGQITSRGYKPESVERVLTELRILRSQIGEDPVKIQF